MWAEFPAERGPWSAEALLAEDMARVVGEGAADRDGKGNISVGDGGVAFLLASTGTLPGGAPLVRRPPSPKRHRYYA